MATNAAAHAQYPPMPDSMAYGQQQENAQLGQQLQQKLQQQHWQMCNTDRNQIVPIMPHHYVDVPVANTLASNRAQLTVKSFYRI
jgi:hypothetical protein